MSHDPGNGRDAIRLSDESAQSLLARATQLDSARVSGASVAELRAAAIDAGIAPEAFEQALAESRVISAATPVGAMSVWRRRSRLVFGFVAGALLLYVIMAVVSRLIP